LRLIAASLHQTIPFRSKKGLAVQGSATGALASLKLKHANLVLGMVYQDPRAVGLARKHWSNAGAIRVIFKEACERFRLPGFNPHSFRHALAILGERTCKTPEQFKAWSQNLGHE
jgi:hypothetical protein